MDKQFADADIVSMTGAAAVEYLGTGSFGETWRTESSDGLSIARKFIYREGYDVERLAREVEGLQRINSPFVVNLLDIGVGNFRGKLIPYMDFEFIAGGDLDQWISKGSCMVDSDAIDLASGLLQGAAALHKAQVLHRDIKPANIGLRGGDPRCPLLLDLGLAKLLDLESITRYPSHVGTAPYMSPEQFRGERAVKGSDMWAIGVVLHEVVSGEHPFFRAGEQLSLADVLERIARPIKPVEAHPALQRLIMRCLRPEPYQRGSAWRAYDRLLGEIRS